MFDLSWNSPVDNRLRAWRFTHKRTRSGLRREIAVPLDADQGLESFWPSLAHPASWELRRGSYPATCGVLGRTSRVRWWTVIHVTARQPATPCYVCDARLFDASD